jgi:hypothetical protein
VDCTVAKLCRWQKECELGSLLVGPWWLPPFRPGHPKGTRQYSVSLVSHLRGSLIVKSFQNDSMETLQHHDWLLTVSSAMTNPPPVRPGLAVSLASLATTPQTVYAAADTPDWGLFAGRTASLLHPWTMGSLLMFALSTAYLGFQWRRQRTLGDEIATLQKKMPPPNLNSSEPRQISPLEVQIATLTRECKEIASKGPRDQHFPKVHSWLALAQCLPLRYKRSCAFYESCCCSANQCSHFILLCCRDH